MLLLEFKCRRRNDGDPTVAWDKLLSTTLFQSEYMVSHMRARDNQSPPAIWQAAERIQVQIS